jgi:endonuclease/exonuclease/phosphatase (EEP) superfamily protein YafD
MRRAFRSVLREATLLCSVLALSASGEVGPETHCESPPKIVSPMAGTLRVVTYNVRRFKASDGSSSVDKIAKALSALQPSVVALNEVDAKLRPDAVANLAGQLGGFHFHFFGHVKGQYGNALLSRFPITATRETHLRGGTELGFPAGTKKLNGEIAKAGELHRLARGMLECDIKVPHAHWHGAICKSSNLQACL